MSWVSQMLQRQLWFRLGGSGPGVNVRTFSCCSPKVGAGTASSQRSSWKTIIRPCRMPSMKAGTWPSAAKGGPSKPPGQGRTKERSTSSRGSRQARLPSPTRTRANASSSSASQPHVEQSATGSRAAFPKAGHKGPGQILLYFCIFSCETVY